MYFIDLDKQYYNEKNKELEKYIEEQNGELINLKNYLKNFENNEENMKELTLKKEKLSKEILKLNENKNIIQKTDQNLIFFSRK